jgi:hypothetical protein
MPDESGPAVSGNLDITTALDVLGLLAVAGGVGAGLWATIGAFSIACAGALVLAGSAFAAWRQVPRKPRSMEEIHRHPTLLARYRLRALALRALRQRPRRLVVAESSIVDELG